nr:hypothetical protein [Mesorhizobium sp.]
MGRKRQAPVLRARHLPVLPKVAIGLLLSCATAAPALADAGAPATFTGAVERHYTTNALDSDHAVPDWYTLLRGSLQRQLGDADANVALGAEFQATRHDTVSIEDDRALALSVSAFRKLENGLEFRGTLSYRASSDGDDLPLGPVTLGMRTLKQVVAAEGQVGVDLGNATTLVLDVSDSMEEVGPTRFESNLLPAVQLDPDTNRLQSTARVTRTFGRLALGASASALLATVARLGSPPVGVSFRQFGLRAEAAYTGAGGLTAGAALGAELIEAADGLYRRVRPAWQLAVVAPLPHGFELRGTYFGRYENADSDDPLASWLQRAEIEGGAKLRPDLTFTAGLFREVKENLLFENRERSRGFYAEAAYRLSPAAEIVLRVDATKTDKTVIDVRESTVDTFIGLRAKL